MDDADTIAAIATSAGIGAIGIIRVSGPMVSRILTAVTGRALPPRKACYVRFTDRAGAPIDEGIGVYFPRPYSYTGEDVCELHGHGGPVVLNALLQRCLDEGARSAQPGEFTKRAFLNGKLDLAQAEAVADLIAAGSLRAAKSAARSLTGEFSRRVRAFQSELTGLRVLLEGSLDFPDEGIDFLAETNAAERLDRLAAGVDAALRAGTTGRILRDGIRVAIVGPPNVGKSSVINALCDYEVAIVTAMPGTTRDPVRETITIDGVPLHIVDTAGIRDTADAVERLGMERTWHAVAQAGLILLVQDVTSPASEPVRERLPHDVPRLYVHNKIDLAHEPARIEERADGLHVWVSAKEGSGIEALRRVMVRAATGSDLQDGEFSARERQLGALRRSLEAIRQAAQRLGEPEVAAEELRSAQEALSELTGVVSSDDLLGEIFSRFCIGK